MVVIYNEYGGYGMATTSILEYLKVAIGDMVDSTGNIRVTPIGITAKRKLSNNKIKFLADLIRLVRDTKIITDETRIYIFNRYISSRKVADLLNESIDNVEDHYKVSTTIAKIQYDKNKLSKIFGERMFLDILSIRDDITVYERALAEQYAKYHRKVDISKSLVIGIPKDCMATELSDEEFDKFISEIEPYTVKNIQEVESRLDVTACGYFNYIMTMGGLTGVNKQREDRIKKVLGIGKEGDK